MATNPPITIGELVAVPAPGSGIRAVEWAQPISSRVVQRFASVADRNARYPVATAGQGATCITLDTMTVWAAVGGSWQQIAGLVTQWTALALNANWSNSGGALQPLQYRKNGDRVEVRGDLQYAAGGANPFATLPATFRPPAGLSFPAANRTSGAVGLYLSIAADGTMSLLGVSGATAFSLGNVGFSVTP